MQMPGMWRLTRQGAWAIAATAVVLLGHLRLEWKLAQCAPPGAAAPPPTDRDEADEFNVRFPHRMLPAESVHPFNGELDTEPLGVSDRLRYLELKSNAWMNWANFYDLESMYDPAVCRRKSRLLEFDPDCEATGDLTPEERCAGLYDHTICLDRLRPGKPCLVYDFGIREQPEFGVMLAKRYGCEVHAFDPSPIAKRFYQQSESLHRLINYKFHDYGAGGRDGKTKLYSYNWGQVSIMQDAIYVNASSCTGDTKEDQCKLVNPQASQETFGLEVRTLPNIMRQLRHHHVDIIKIDVEGSEYAFLEHAFDTLGCLPCDQLTVEWHHFPLDPRYGAGSSPPLNALVTLMHKCGFRQFHHHVPGGWPSSDAHFVAMNMRDVRYNIVSFVRVDPTE